MIYFVTGTDTDVGKTYVSKTLLAAAKNQGFSTLGIKPIAAGCEQTEQGLRNSDALALMQHSSCQLAYEQVNPIALAPAIAPHIAAWQQGETIAIHSLIDAIPRAAMDQVDLCLVEGAGGWLLPINRQETLDQWVAWEGWPVILVVGIRLGCLNHALLTVQAIKARGVSLAGWIANEIDPNMSHYQANLDSLKQMIHAPLLAELRYGTSVAEKGLLPALQELIHPSLVR